MTNRFEELKNDLLPRFWDTENKEMVYPCLYNTKLAVISHQSGQHHILNDDVWLNPKFIPMKPTGLHDKNGVLIYEGDVVRKHTQFNLAVHGEFVNYEIILRNGYIMASYVSSENGFILPRGYSCGLLKDVCFEDLSKYFYLMDDEDYTKLDKIEIIGNIHENPDFLND